MVANLYLEGTTHMQIIGALNFLKYWCQDCPKRAEYWCNRCGVSYCGECARKHPKHPLWD
jgi:hypothetical protein